MYEVKLINNNDERIINAVSTNNEAPRITGQCKFGIIRFITKPGPVAIATGPTNFSLSLCSRPSPWGEGAPARGRMRGKYYPSSVKNQRFLPASPQGEAFAPSALRKR